MEVLSQSGGPHFCSSSEKQHGWSPYADNGGTSVGVAAANAAILIADTRMSSGYSIHTRKGSKITQLTSKCAISSCGMKADAIALHKKLKIDIEMYKHAHRKEPGLKAIAQLLSTTLYGRRFFPFYTFNILAGVTDEGIGACYHYDAIGSFELVDYTTSGSGSSLAHPVLDSIIQQMNVLPDKRRKKELSDEALVSLCKDVLSSTGERDIYTGDSTEVLLITNSGVVKENFALRKD